MADSSPVPEHRGKRQSTINEVQIHRVNDFSHGHVGRISYKPWDDPEAGVGELSANRLVEQPPLLREILPSTEWLPATRSALPEHGFSKSWQYGYSQRNWLLKAHPESFLGNSGLQTVLSGEAQALRRSDPGDADQTVSLLSVGEITDASDPSHVGAWPAVAIAAGEAGHILRLSTISVEDRVWEGGRLALQMGTSKSGFQGFWSGDGVPISQIKFARKFNKDGQIRWLIAQKATSTTIFNPRLQKRPVAGGGPKCYLDDGDPSHINPNPIVTITCDSTGGDAQCDFSLNPGAEENDPQIAIIDGSGNWSIWCLEQEGSLKTSVPRAMLKKRGMAVQVPSLFVGNPTTAPDERYRIAWLGNAESVDNEVGAASPLASSSTADPLRPSNFFGNDVPSDLGQEKLLICDRASLQVLHVDEGSVMSSINLYKRGSVAQVLDVHLFPDCSSYIFVLTTQKLFLLDTNKSQDRETSSLDVLVSCPHFRFQDQGPLRMTVTKVSSTTEQMSAIVLVFSSQNSRIDVFHFTLSSDGGNVQFHQHTVHLPREFTATETSNPQGIQSLVAVPLRPLPHGKEKPRSVSYAHKTNEAEYYQLFELGAHLGLRSSLVAVAISEKRISMPSNVSTSQISDEGRHQRSLRKNFLRQAKKTFVVPDDEAVEEIAQVAVSQQAWVARDVIRPTTTIQLRYYFLRLLQEVNNSLFGGVAASETSGRNVTEHFDLVRDAIKGQEGDNGFITLRPLLSFSDHLPPFSLPDVEDDWNRRMKRLRRSKQIQLFEHGTYSHRLHISDLFEKLSINWSAKLSHKVKGPQLEHLQMILERMAAEVMLSEQGLKLVPQSTRPLESRTVPRLQNDNITEEFLDEEAPILSHLGSEAALLTPSAMPSSSRATSEATETAEEVSQDTEQGQEDPAAARLRMYLPSINFVPPMKHPQSRLLSLWPEQRGSNPAAYTFSHKSKRSDGEADAMRRRDREEERHRRRLERRARLERGASESFSQPLPPVVQSSPPPQVAMSSQSHGHSQSQSQSYSQHASLPFGTMSQVVPGEFGGRLARKGKVKHKKKMGFR